MPQNKEDVPQLSMSQLSEMLVASYIEAMKQGLPDSGVGKAEAKHGIFPTNKPGDEKNLSKTARVNTFLRNIVLNQRNPGLQLDIEGNNETTPTEGGYLVPEDFRADFYQRPVEGEVVRPRAVTLQTTRDNLKVPALEQGSDEFGGITMGYVDEGQSKPETQPAFRLVNFAPHKIARLVPVTDELLEDSAIDLSTLIPQLVIEKMRHFLDAQYLAGSNMGRIEGILSTPNLLTIGRVADGDVHPDDLIRMAGKIKAAYLPGSVYIMSQDAATQLQLRREGSGTGQYLWQPSLQAGQPPVFNGRPVIITEKTPVLGMRGDVILANLDNYWIVDNRNIRVTSSIHYKFANDITTWRFVMRSDGKLMDPKAAVALDVQGS